MLSKKKLGCIEIVNLSLQHEKSLYSVSFPNKSNSIMILFLHWLHFSKHLFQLHAVCQTQKFINICSFNSTLKVDNKYIMYNWMIYTLKRLETFLLRRVDKSWFVQWLITRYLTLFIQIISTRNSSIRALHLTLN